MPKAAYCSECAGYVWLGKDGRCVGGHPRSNLRGLYDAQMDSATGNAIPPFDYPLKPERSRARRLADTLGAGVVARAAAANRRMRVAAATMLGQLAAWTQHLVTARPPRATVVAAVAVAVALVCLGIAIGAITRGPSSRPSATRSRDSGSSGSWDPEAEEPTPWSDPDPAPSAWPEPDPVPYSRSSRPPVTPSNCYSCDGTGLSKCGWCRGTGRSNYIDGECLSCDGMGHVACSRCEGSGRL
jgi:hypothetical protein